MVPHPISLLLLAALLACTPAPHSDSHAPGIEVFEGKVIAVADGDTFTVLRDTLQVRVRLEGIDCPEKKQPFGNKAKQTVSEMVFAKHVRVVESSKDRNKRSIAKVYLSDGRCVNEEMLRLGMAWHFKKYSDDARLARLEERARKSQIGLWGEPDPIAPWEWRKGSR